MVPKSMLWGWQAELARFRPGLKVARYHGPDRALDPEADVTLTTDEDAQSDDGVVRPGNAPD